MRRFTLWGALIYIALVGSSTIGESSGAIAQSVPGGVSANRFTLTLEREAEESYATLERRAEAAARAATQRTFDSDILVRAVAVTIVAENRGLAAPVLTLQVTREQWRQLPDPQRWSSYYPTAQALLQLSPASTAATTVPAAAPIEALPAPTEAPSSTLPTIPLPQQVPGRPTLPQAAPTTLPLGQ